MFVALPGWGWLCLAAFVYEFSFILDCADGQLARVKKIASPLGHLLDFLMDELKAMLIFGAVTVRLWRFESELLPSWLGANGVLLVGLAGLFCLASGISLTSFMRRPEYGAPPPTEDGQPATMGNRRGLVGRALNFLEWVARFIVHYPQYIFLCALAHRMDVYFWAYAAVNVLYLGKAMASILLRLGRFLPKTSGAVANG